MKPQEVYRKTLELKGEGTYSLIEQLEQICKREGWSKNLCIRKAIEEYVVRHGPGNNSFQLDKFGVTWTKATSVNKCGFKNCVGLAVAVGLFVPQNQTYGLCKLHLGVARGAPAVWRDLKVGSGEGTV